MNKPREEKMKRINVNYEKPKVMSIGELQYLVAAGNTKLRKEYEGKEILLINLTKKKLIGTFVFNRVPREYKFNEIFELD